MKYFFDSDHFMPHGHCYAWDPGILWTSVISDGLIFASYTAIPFTLVFLIMRKRKDLPFNWMFVCFGAFIVACGLTHLMEIITVWKPFYPISAIIKAITAAASVPTAIILYRIAPKIVQLPTLQRLVNEQSLRLKAEAASEAKDRFIAVLSHELRTPLTPVKAGLSLLEQELKGRGADGSLSPEARDAFAMVRRNVEMETMLINDLLDVSLAAQRQLHIERRLVDLADVVRQSLLLFQEEMANKKISIDFKIRTERTFVMGAATRLHQVINNLLSNAIKFTPEDGEIALTLESDASNLRLLVRDNGRGIDPESLERIFRPFEQGDRLAAKSRSGLGLGLTISRTIAELHNGRLMGESAGLGQGATFILELPLADPSTAVTADSSPSPPHSLDHDGAGQRILLVEDHADTLRVLAELLRKAGYTVQTAENIRQAEALLGDASVLISDIGLPDGNGCDLMRRFRERGGSHGIAITGFGREEDVARSVQAGFAKHFTKPVDIDALKSALRTMSPSIDHRSA